MGRKQRWLSLLVSAGLLLAGSLPAAAQEDQSEPSSSVDELAVVDAPESLILNGTKLESQAMRAPALNDQVSMVMKDLISEDLSIYCQVLACYDYLTEQMTYGDQMAYLQTPIGSTTCGDIFYTYGELEGFAAVALTANVGYCNGYAAGFIAMARRIGLDANLVRGSVRGADGGQVYHEWAEITIDDTRYVFDPQLDQQLEEQGLGSYTLFCKTYDQLGSRYQISSRP